MTKDVIIGIKGMQSDMFESDEIEVVTTGQYYEKKDNIYLSYIDTTINKDEETNTTIKISEDQVSILRFGGLNTHMVFELHKNHITHYETPYGMFEISTLTKEIKLLKEPDYMEINVVYNLNINHMSMGLNTFTVTVKNMKAERFVMSDDDVMDVSEQNT